MDWVGHKSGQKLGGSAIGIVQIFKKNKRNSKLSDAIGVASKPNGRQTLSLTAKHGEKIRKL
jgi:hypothetical protein